jgi:hypothetical protein
VSASGDAFETETGAGPGIAWTRFARVSVAFIATTFFDGIARVVGGLFEAFLIRPAAGAANFVGDLTRTVFGPAVTGQVGTWANPLVAFVGDLGILGFPAALVLVLVIFWLIQNIRKVVT